MQRSRRGDFGGNTGKAGGFGGGLGMNSLTGTPMYMSPEVIKNDKRGRHGAMDVWSLGCVVLEFATGKKPWSNLDNEWYDHH
jgi:mitogen-activated protein kinase kinase kinase